MPQLWRNSQKTDFLKIGSNTNKIEKPMNQEKLFSLKEKITEQKFQWVKTQDPNLLGKVVRCRDVDMINNKYIVIFDDGSRVDSELLNRNLLMLHGDMPPLSREEVMSIYPPQPTKTQVNINKITPNPFENMQTQEPITQTISNPTTGIKQNMFTIFNAEESMLSLKLAVKLPDKKLLKMMYLSAENKQDFMDQLAEYLSTRINKSVIIESMKQLLDTPQTTKPELKTQIKIKEVDESK